jgi:hypothetical protein
VFFAIAALGATGGTAKFYEEKEIVPGLKLGLIYIMGYLSIASATLSFFFAYGMLKGIRLLPKIYRFSIPVFSVLVIIVSSIVVVRDPVYKSPLLNISWGLANFAIGILIDRYLHRPNVKSYFSQEVEHKDHLG